MPRPLCEYTSEVCSVYRARVGSPVGFSAWRSASSICWPIRSEIGSTLIARRSALADVLCGSAYSRSQPHPDTVIDSTAVRVSRTPARLAISGDDADDPVGHDDDFARRPAL